MGDQELRATTPIIRRTPTGEIHHMTLDGSGRIGGLRRLGTISDLRRGPLTEALMRRELPTERQRRRTASADTTGVTQSSVSTSVEQLLGLTEAGDSQSNPFVDRSVWPDGGVRRSILTDPGVPGLRFPRATASVSREPSGSANFS